MSNTHETSRSEPPIKQRLRNEVNVGIAMAADPANVDLPDLVIRVTTIYSPWFARACRVCRDKFREGDRVRLCPQCSEPYHDDDEFNLHCWQKYFTEGKKCATGDFDPRFSEGPADAAPCGYVWDGHFPETDTASSVGTKAARAPQMPPVGLVSCFVAGVETVWRPYGSQQNFRVTSESPQVGRICPWCKSAIRVNEWVVECPCTSNCGTIFHQDVSRHRTCWNEWNGVEGKNYCPNTGAPYKVAASSGREESHGD